MPFTLKKQPEVILAEDHDASIVLTDPKREMGAVLLASGKPKTHIARQLNVSKDAVYEWVHDPVWTARVEYWRAVNYRAATEAGIGNAKARVVSLVDLYERKLQGVIDRGNDPFWDGYPADPHCTTCLRPGTSNGDRLLRGSWPECPDCGYRPPIPEGKQGFHYYRHAPVPGKGAPFMTIVQVFIDTDTPKVLMALNKQIAEHLGEWNREPVKHDVVVRQIIGINADDL